MKIEETKNNNEKIQESMNKVFDKYEDVLKRLADSEKPKRQHKEGAD
jgi:hypothetical protein